MPRLRQVDLSSLSMPEIELGLKVVSQSLVLDLSPSNLMPPELSHLTETQWESLFWFHLNLLHQKEHNPIH